MINRTVTADEIIDMWQWETRGYKSVKPELPDQQDKCFY
jgi:hypothetical protein